MKNWILKLKFVQQAINTASMEGTDFGRQQSNEATYRKAFNDARKDLEETNKDNFTDKVEAEVSSRISKLLGVVDENFIITYDKKTGLVFLGGVRLDEPQIMNLKSEAEAITSMQIWKTLSETIKEQAQKTIFNNSIEWQDVLNGKMCLYTLSLQQKVLDIFKDYKSKSK